jgi:hypothetical protein
VRQSLYILEDCLNGGAFKALAAAKRLKDIFPSLVSLFITSFLHTHILFVFGISISLTFKSLKLCDFVKETKGIVATIPMPGHLITSPQDIEDTKQTVKLLEVCTNSITQHNIEMT